MIALAKASFARRSQSAGGFGNPPRVPISIDANHPLAGTTLNFDVQVVEVRAATPEDLQPSCGSCSSCSGHHDH